MGFHVLQILLIITIFFSTPTSSNTLPPHFPIANPNCTDRCGNISVPFPFGTTKNCYLNHYFFVTCNNTFPDSPKLFAEDTEIEITDISLDGQVKYLQFIAHDCHDQKGQSNLQNDAWINVGKYFTVNNTANKFTIVGCDTYGFVSGRRLDGNYTTGCTAMCNAKQDLVERSCMGLGCCQISFPEDVWRVEIDLRTYRNYTRVLDFNDCGFAFLAEDNAFNFSRESFSNLKNITKLPMVVDWAIGNETCEKARLDSSTYACKSPNSICYMPNNGYGYRCRCDIGYEGNPYLSDGCQDIDECRSPNLNKCKYECVNTLREYYCPCPKGYYGDGKIDGEGCIRGKSLTLKLVVGISVGIIGLLLGAFWLYLELKRRRLIRMKQMFFLQNGGKLLQEKLTKRERSLDAVRIFNSSELQQATNNFHDSMIVGQGGFGTVYKGFLPNKRIVAIKRSKRVDPSQVEQFINEVIILSQINHRNVVRLLGCCLEIEVPLLVYEFITNGALSAYLHNRTKACLLSWDIRLKIAVETASVLSYLHSTTTTPIIHRDVKSDNILLDETFTSKVSDFGASRLVPVDQTQISTMVQGTLGYLDPEYLQTNQLTEKSDVYSFGVVLLELLTGRKAISFDKPEEEKSLANFCLSILRQERFFQVVDDNILLHENKKQISKVAKLAKGCLNVKGDDRPSMREVAMELEKLRLGERHAWAQTAQNLEEMESLLGEGYNDFANCYDVGTSVGYDSLKNHALLPFSGAR